ncbi:MAG TPA: TonB-dependent receptor [Acidobacteriaceae bacterium]
MTSCLRFTRISCFAISLLILVLAAASALGQATSGSISGRVTDARGAVVPGAQVSIVDRDKGLITNATTDGAGEFTAQALPPDRYTITVEKSGFANANVGAFKLDIDQKAHFNISLKIGDVSSTVTVTDSGPVLQTQGAETGQVMGTREIEDLPLEGRDFTSLFKLIPGVVSGGGGNNLNLAVNGQREFSNSVQINGVEVTGNRNNDTNVRPSPDATQEFKVVTSAYAPEFGRASGGSVIIQTKSGTNNLHGSLYEFYRPTATSANPARSPAGTVPTLVQNVYGGTFGMPLKRDKAFLFLAYEGNRNHNSSSYNGQTAPNNQVTFNTAGDADLSQLLDPTSGFPIPIFNPYYFETYGSPQRFSGNIIPAALVSHAGRAILQQLFPAPQGTDIYSNFAVTQYFTSNSNVANLRTDYTFSQNNRIYLTYDAEQGDTSSSDPYAGYTAYPGTGGGDGGGDLTSFENHVVGLTYDHTFSASLLNEARGNWFLSTVKQNNLIDGSNLATAFGIANSNIPGFPQTYSFPQIQFQSGPTVGGSTYKPLSFRDKNLGFVDTLSWTGKGHNVKLGYEYRHLSSHPDFSLFPVPYQYYGGAYSALTSDPIYCQYSYLPCNEPDGFYDKSYYYGTGGSEVADLLLGLPLYTSQGLQLTKASTTANEHTFYLQDYWQVTPRLNITYGLRYEYQQPYVEKNNNQSNFDVNTLMIQLAGRGNNSRSLINSNTKDFMPRVGWDFQITPTIVLRGGFGIFYSPENDAREDLLTKNYPFFVQQEIDNSAYAIAYHLDAGVARPTSISIPGGASSINLVTASVPSQTVYSEPNNFPTANSKNYNVTLQKTVGNTSFEVAYVGAITRDLSYEVGDYNINKRLSTNIGKVQTLLPVGISNYDSLQAKVNRRFSRGYSLLASYTWSHARDNGPAPFNLNGSTGPQDPLNVNVEYASSDSDVRNVFVASQIIELPFGRNKRFFSGAGPIANAIVGGWQVNSITTLQGGRPFNILSASNNKNYPSLRPNLTGTSAAVGHRSVNRWFNPAAFQVSSTQAANHTPGTTPRNYLRGPGFTNEDMSLIKVYALPRSMKLQVRIEAFNLLNTAHYDAPVATVSDIRFGQIIGGYTPRVMQFAGRLTF